MHCAFGLDVLAMNDEASHKRRGKIQHVYICLPFARFELYNGVTPTHLPNPGAFRTGQGVRLETFVGRTRSRISGGSNDRFTTRYSRSVCEVDPEYLQLTDDKILRINRALRELRLEVDLWNPHIPLQPQGFSRRSHGPAPWGSPGSVSRLASSFPTLRLSDVPRSWRPRQPYLSFAKPTHVLDHRHGQWPTRKDEKGDVLYVPKLISLSQMSLNEWPASHRDP